MAIEKNNFKVSRVDSEFSPGSRKSMSSDEDELQRRSSAVESDDDDEFDDADSGAGSDDFDLLELGETGVEFCQVGNQTCSIPFELYDLQGLEDILSIDVWNECLTEEERFGLTKYLPDMDQESYMLTLKELFTGCSLHFGSPVKKLFDMLKGGLCEPRVALYREGLNFFQKRQHYHLLRKHQNTMVSNLCQIRDAWLNCRGYSIEERLRVLNIIKSQKSLMHEKMEDLETDSSERESEEGLRNIRIKDRKILQKIGRHSDYGLGSNVDIRGGSLASEFTKYGKQNPKGTLKLGGSKNPTAKELGGRITSVYHSHNMNSGPYSSTVAHPRHSKATRYESGAGVRMRDQMRSSDDAEETYGIGDRQDRISIMEKSGVLKIGRKHLPRGDELASESLMGLPLSSKTDLHLYGRRRDVNVLSEANLYTVKPPSMRSAYDFPKNAKYPDNFQQFVVGDQMKSLKGRISHQALKGNRVDSSERAEPFWNSRGQEEAFTVDSPFRSDDWNVKSKKWKAGRESPDLNYKSYRPLPQQMNDRYLPSEYKSKPFEEIRGQNGGPDTAAIRGNKLFNSNEETESESSDQSYDDEDSNPLLRSKMAYPTGAAEASRPSLLKPGQGSKKAKLVKKDLKGNARVVDGIMLSSKKIGGLVEQGHMHSVDKYSLKAKQKGKMRDSPLSEAPARVLEDDYSLGPGKFADDDNDRIYNLVKNGQLSAEPGERLRVPSVKAYPADGKPKKGIFHDPSVTQPNHSHDHAVDEKDDSHQPRPLADGKKQGKLKKKGKNTHVSDHFERSEAPLLGCSATTKKRKGKIDVTETYKGDEDNKLVSNHRHDVDNSNSLKKKAKRMVEADTGSSEMETSEPPVSEMGAAEMELENKPQKKAFTLITPTVHTGFSFSIIHLLSAVRLAMITPLPEDTLDVGKPVDEQNKVGGVNGALSHEKVDVEHAGDVNVPSLTVQEIVNRVRSNPGDPCILETQEPLQDLVRGVLKIFSSKTAPLGAKGWKTLAVYERTTKSWSWLGPVSHSSSDHEAIEEVTSPEVWGLPHKMLVKLVDSFANWLKSGQETLQQIGSLPAPPLALMQLNLDEKERFRDLRAQKSLNTINPSSEEVRSYFRKEEVLRYSIPDRAFSYTAADGRKSIVAPLRRCGGKPTSKARDHFMLKRDRPPHVTILCLVRDAAARLPGSIGTRADVCTLIRDSQYIVEDVSDAQVNQVVSGALDRLHYERDPCVQFDGERKLWVYLHREREEEDFEDDGTSSTKKWKRQKKEAADQADQGAVTVAYHGTADQAGYDLCSDLNAEPSGVDDKGAELGFDDARQNVDDSVDLNQGSEQGDVHQSHSVVLEGLDLNPIRENKLLCQENSTNEDFDDETFGRERPVGLLSASLS